MTYNRLAAEAVYFGAVADGAESRQEEIDELRLKLGAAQAKIDALMLEFCPDEMTQEQLAEWAKHQCRAGEEA